MTLGHFQYLPNFLVAFIGNKFMFSFEGSWLGIVPDQLLGH